MSLGKGLIKVTETAHGLMAFNSQDIYVGKSLDMYGEFSAQERDALLDLIPDGGVVVDVGANIGALSVPLARKAGLVLALEPQRGMFDLLQANLALNSLTNLQIACVAAGSDPGTAWFPYLDYRCANNYGGLSLLREDDVPDPQTTYEIPVETLDRLLEGIDKLHLIKIDVEGMEREVLAGAMETIKKFRPILYVEDDRAEKREELRRFITEELSYDYHLHVTPLFRPDNFNRHEVNVWGGNIVSSNLICVPKEFDHAA